MSCSGLPARRRLLHTIEASQRNLMGGSDADDWPKGSYCNKTAQLNEGCDCASQVCGRALLGAHLNSWGPVFIMLWPTRRQRRSWELRPCRAAVCGRCAAAGDVPSPVCCLYPWKAAPDWPATAGLPEAPDRNGG